jgi:hypothetical protein
MGLSFGKGQARDERSPTATAIESDYLVVMAAILWDGLSCAINGPAWSAHRLAIPLHVPVSHASRKRERLNRGELAARALATACVASLHPAMRPVNS